MYYFEPCYNSIKLQRKRKSEFNLISPIVRETGHIDTKMNLKKYYLKKSKGKKE